jgi:hypothetical protein
LGRRSRWRKGLQVARRFGQGAPSMLNHDQIALANFKGAVSILTCYCGTRCDYLSPEHVFAVREKRAEAFRFAHQGYRWKELAYWGRDASTGARCRLPAPAQLLRVLSRYQSGLAGSRETAVAGGTLKARSLGRLRETRLGVVVFKQFYVPH